MNELGKVCLDGLDRRLDQNNWLRTLDRVGTGHRSDRFVLLLRLLLLWKLIPLLVAVGQREAALESNHSNEC